jgi:hypothetical protein
VIVTEQRIASSIASGVLASPVFWEGSSFFALRFSGTGCAYRNAASEYCFRPPEIWLAPEFCRRVVGCPVVIGHPAAGVLNGAEFIRRCVGSVIYAWPRDDELWCVARILDENAAAVLEKGEFDTSPSVVFSPDTNATIFVDGERLLVEGEPRLIDHLAICPAGVWGVGRGAEPGVEVQEDERKVA